MAKKSTKSAADAAPKAVAVISFNKERNGIELRLPDGRHLTTDEKAILKSLGFAWHRQKQFYYTRFTEEKYELIKASFLGKDSQFPAKTEAKVMKEIAAQFWQEQKEKKAAAPKRTSGTAAEVAELRNQVATLADGMAKLLAAMQPQTAGK